MSDRLKPLGENLGALFTALEQRSRASIDLTSRVRTALQGPEKNHVISANYRGDTLVVLVDSAAWSSYVRYAQTQLLDALRAQGETHVTKLKVKVGRQEGGLE
jgi:hypothetical protein